MQLRVLSGRSLATRCRRPGPCNPAPSSSWRLPCFPCSPFAGVTSHAPASCEVRLLQVDVLRVRWMWTRTSVYRHYSRVRCTGRRAPAEEKDEERKTMMCRDKKKKDPEREEIHVFAYDLMVRMPYAILDSRLEYCRIIQSWYYSARRIFERIGIKRAGPP